jgi:hypothetical protein
LHATTCNDATTAELEEFVRELRAHYSLSGKNGQEQLWAGRFRAAEGFMIVPTRNARADEVREVVRGLARRHGLAAYDPHLEEVFIGPPGGGSR